MAFGTTSAGAMRSEAASAYRHPNTGAPLTPHVLSYEGDQVVGGWLEADGDRFPIENGIPRFCPPENYAASFGYQWSRYRTTQLDSRSGGRAQSAVRLFDQTRWPARLDGQRVLEAGSGMGRFTEVLAETGAEVFSFDFSCAIDVNAQNNARFSKVHWAQADLLAPPFAPQTFDKVLCLGVLQHTPSPQRAFESLVRLLKPGGSIAIDVYALDWRSVLLGKYYLRPLTRRLPLPLLHRLVRAHVAWVYPLTGFLQRYVTPRARHLSWVLGVADYRGRYPLEPARAREWAEMDTFDMLSPRYDRPQTAARVRRWMHEADMVDVVVTTAHGTVQARGRLPGSHPTQA